MMESAPTILPKRLPDVAADHKHGSLAGDRE